MKSQVVPVALLLFISGACALVFQVAWMREFRLVFGVSTAATGAVLAIFMGGLGVGGAVLGKRVDRSASPIAWYGGLLLLISVSAGASPLLIDLIRRFYVALGGQTALGTAGAGALRLLLSSAVLGIPTFLMGGTLPAAVRGVTSKEDSRRRGAGLLYGLNTLGAVFGAVASTFWMLPLLGTRMTFWLACAVNLLAALGAWRLARRATAEPPGKPLPDTPAQPRPAEEASPQTDAPAPALLVYAAAATLGFAFFLMEIVWYRMLGPVLGGSTYTFGLILAVALFGIGVGGAAYPLLFRRLKPTLSAFAFCCGLEAACIAAPYALGDRIALLAAVFGESAGSFHALVGGWVLVAAIVVLPAALVSGLQFPLLIALLGRGDRDVGKQTGLASAWNTVGAIAGSLAGGFGLLPLLTASGTWVAVVIVLSLLGFVLVIASLARERSPARLLLPAAVIILALGLRTATGPTSVWRHSAIGAGRSTLPETRTANSVRNWMHEIRRTTRWEAEGIEASIAICIKDDLSFLVNGKTDGSAVGDSATQIMGGLLGAVLHREAKSAAVVGLGTGQSAGWLAAVPSVDRVDVIEIEPAVDEMARLCAASNHDVLNHPKARRIYNDAREVLLTTSDRYDVIASEPSNPYRAGIGGLYTREFFEVCRRRLNEGGLLVQWLQGYEISAETICTVMVTLASVYPHVEVWQGCKGDMLLVCSMAPPSYSAARLKQRVAEEPFQSALAAAWGVYDLEGFLSHYIAGNELAVDMVRRGLGNVNTDDHNRIEYDFARTVGRQTGLSPFSLRVTATDLGARNPRLAEGAADWDLVEAYRGWQYDESVFPHDLPLDLSWKLEAKQAVRRFLLSRAPSRALEGYEAEPYEPVFPFEVMLLALAYADVGNAKAMPLVERLRALRPTEAAIIEARLLYRQGKIQEAAAMALQAVGMIRVDPWARTSVARSGLGLAALVASEYPPAAPQLLAALEEPFVLYHLEQTRAAAKCDIGSRLSPEAVALALEAFEPHVPWNKSFLETRKAIYAAARHPLLSQATEDLETFLRLARKTDEPGPVAPPVSPP